MGYVQIERDERGNVVVQYSQGSQQRSSSVTDLLLFEILEELRHANGTLRNLEDHGRAL